MSGPKVGFVTGLAVEASVLRRDLAAGAQGSCGEALIACAGASTRRAHLEAERLIEAGAGALVSFGIAGGLDPGLAPGAL